MGDIEKILQILQNDDLFCIESTIEPLKLKGGTEGGAVRNEEEKCL